MTPMQRYRSYVSASIAGGMAPSEAALRAINHVFEGWNEVHAPKAQAAIMIRLGLCMETRQRYHNLALEIEAIAGSEPTIEAAIRAADKLYINELAHIERLARKGYTTPHYRKHCLQEARIILRWLKYYRPGFFGQVFEALTTALHERVTQFIVIEGGR